MSTSINGKTALRTALLSSRQTLKEDERRQKNQLIKQNLIELAPVKDCRSVFCFISSVNEVDTHDIIEHLLNSKKRLAVPRISADKHMQAIVFPGWDGLEKGQLGILSPKHSHPLASEITITLTPGLAFSRAGARLGYGRGYYDKWFAENGGGLKIALAYEMQILDTIPTDEHDINVDVIVTEAGVIYPSE